MHPSLTLYFARPLTAADLGAAWLGAADHGPVAMARLGRTQITLHQLPTDNARAHVVARRGLLGVSLVARVPDFAERLAGSEGVLNVTVEPALDAIARAWVTALVRRLGGFVFNGEAFVDADGGELAGPPGPGELEGDENPPTDEVPAKLVSAGVSEAAPATGAAEAAVVATGPEVEPGTEPAEALPEADVPAAVEAVAAAEAAPPAEEVPPVETAPPADEVPPAAEEPQEEPPQAEPPPPPGDDEDVEDAATDLGARTIRA